MTIGQIPKEAFPIGTFRFLEGKIHVLRTIVMKRAAEIARGKCLKAKPIPEFYEVKEEDVIETLNEILDNPNVARKAMGLPIIQRAEERTSGGVKNWGASGEDGEAD